jgi:undecaprenyl-phosphate 4-deoxy-4-formamido-L-arabinose transferase
LGLVLKVTNKIGGIELQQRSRIDGKSTYSLKKLIKLWVNAYTAYTIIPLRIASAGGIISAFIGLIYAIIIVVKKLVGISVVSGYSSLMCVILFIGGFILLCLGIIGEYLGRTYMSANELPSYVIREVNIQKREDNTNV